MMRGKDDDDLKGPEALREIGLRLGGLFAGLRDVFDAAAKQAPSAGAERAGGGGAEGAGAHDGAEEVEIQTTKGPVTAKVSYGVRMSGLFGGDDTLETAMRRAKGRPAPRTADAAPEPRRAEIELFEEADTLVAAAELPGVAPGELQIEIEGAVLRLRTTGARRFAAEAEIAMETARRLDARKLETRLTNGVAEIRIPLKSPLADSAAGETPE